MDRNLNALLKWSIEAQTAGTDTTNGNTNGDTNGTSNRAVALPTPADGAETQEAVAAAPSAPAARSDLTPDILAALLGGPSDADLMKESMAVITSSNPEVSLENKLIAFDNFEQLIESLDNANNMATLSLWGPLLAQLGHAEAEVRRYAAWCVGTAVQNNEKSQERLLAMGGLPALVKVALNGEEKGDVRRKAVYALSSATRNYQPALDIVLAELVKAGHRAEGEGEVDATNMDAVDAVMEPLKEKAKAST